MGVWAAAALYAAGVIGAGFASGKELAVFFVNYGRAGLVGAILAWLLLLVGSGLILESCAKYNVSSYGQLLHSLQPGLARVFDFLYALFLLVGISVMFAGMGAFGRSPLHSAVLRLGSGLLVLLVLYQGVEAVLKVNAWLAPFLAAVLCGLSLWHLATGGVQLQAEGSWQALEAATLYSCYNLGFALAVLASVHRSLKTRIERWLTALAGSTVLGLCLIVSYLALSTLEPVELTSAFPVLYLIEKWGFYPRLLLTFMLWTAMYTTAVANSLALVTRVQEVTPLRWPRAALLVVILGLSLSHLGFGWLVQVAYPLLGLAGLWILAQLVWESLA